MLLPRPLLPLWIPLLLALPALGASPPQLAAATDDTADRDDVEPSDEAEQAQEAAEGPSEEDAEHEAAEQQRDTSDEDLSLTDDDDDDDDDDDSEQDVDGFIADRCPELTGPARRHDRHARWRYRHRVDVDYGGTGWEIAMRGDVPQRVRTGLFEGATILNVQPVATEDSGAVEWVAVVDLSGDLAQLCDADQVELRMDDAFGRGAHVIALHHEGVLLRDRDNELVFLSAEDSEVVPSIELVYTSSFQLVNAPKVKKAKKKRRKKRRRRRRRRR